jgi:cation transport regulator ChaC
MRVVTASVLGLLIAVPLLAQEPQPQQPPQTPEPQEREREHVVRRGDTLWDLAGQYYRNPFQWPRIHAVNTRIVRDPHWIYPDQVLIIPGFRELVQPATQDAAAAYVATRQADRAARTVFYTAPLQRLSDGPTVLMEPLAERVPVKPGEFYRAEFLASPATLPVVGRVIRSTRDMERTTEGIVQSAQPHDELYVAYTTSTAPAIGDLLLVAEVGGRVPAAGLDARVIDPRAVVRVMEHDREVMRVHVEHQFGRVVRDQLVLPLEMYPEFAIPAAEPVAGEYDMEASILRFMDEGPLPSRLARAFVNAGRTHGVQVGDIFHVYLPARASREWDGRTEGTVYQVPAEAIAEVRVVRVREASATVIVDHLWKPQLEAGLPVRRVRKMP